MTQTIRRPAPRASLAGKLFLSVLISAVLCAPAAGAGGGSSSSVPDVPALEESPEQNAARHYNMGLKARDKAWKLEKEAAEADGAKAEKLLGKARKEYEKAVKFQRNAITANPRMHEAHSSLGYALRKIGEYPESIASYDRALEISPGYTEAIEYRAEAYLALGRLDEAKEAYLLLIRNDQARADELMTAMKRWLEENQAGSSEISAADVEAFATWVEERAEIAGHAAMLAPAGRSDW